MTWKKLDTRGFFGIGVYHLKNGLNLGTLWRSAFIFGATFIFVIGRRYKPQASDTLKTPRHVPLFHFDSFADFKEKLPVDSQLIGIECGVKARDLGGYAHPERAVYLLGAEDGGIPQAILDGCYQVVQIPCVIEHCLNVSTAGSIVMYDRLVKRSKR